MGMNMSNDVPESFALARRGLPLPATTHAPWRSAWLPSAARSPVRVLSAASGRPTAPAPTPQAEGDEPWWMEAGEWVPPEQADAPALEPPSPEWVTASVSPEPPSTHPGSASVPWRRNGPQVEPQPGMNPVRGAISARQTMPAPSPAPVSRLSNSLAPQATGPLDAAVPSAAPTHKSAVLARLHPPPSAAPTPGSAVTARPNPAASRTTAILASQTPAAPVAHHGPPEPAKVAACSPPPPALTSVNETMAETVPDQAKHPLLPAHPAPPPREALNRAPWAAPAITPPAPQATTSASQPEAPVLQQRMGAPQASASRTSPAQAQAMPTDMAALLGPPPKRERQVYIDRIEVTVQAPPAVAPQPAAPKPAPASVRAPSATHAYRNPWSGYHARRD